MIGPGNCLSRHRAPMASSTCCCTGCQWKALVRHGHLSTGPGAHLRFQEWVAAGVFLELWRVGLERYDELKGTGLELA